MTNEEYILTLGMIEQEIKKLQEQFQMVEQQIVEFQSLNLSLQELEKTKEKRMLANLGKNIFIKTDIENKELLVDVGNSTFVKKTIPETVKVIEEQLSKLLQTKDKILMRMQELQAKAEEAITHAQVAQDSEKKK